MDPSIPLDQTPAGVPPPGIVPNFVDPPSNTQAIIVINTVLVPITTIFVATRLWSNLHTVRRVGWDDGEFLVYVCVLTQLTSASFLCTSYDLYIYYGRSKYRW